MAKAVQPGGEPDIMEPLADKAIEQLKQAIFQQLKVSSALSEYELLQALRRDGQLDLLPPTPSEKLKLFRCHFLIMHCLYELQREQAGHWEISALRIVFRPQQSAGGAEPGHGAVTSGGDTFLRHYYADLMELYQADEHTVDALLNNFWNRLDAWNSEAEALSLLDLPEGSPWPEVKAAYRRKAQQLHPDRGGDAREFDRLRGAFEQLKRLRG